MTGRKLLFAGLTLVAFVLASPVPGSRLAAQAIERSMTVSVVDDAGAPVPDLGLTDFIIREDNMAREILKVAPATEPMHVALLIDTSRAARDNIAHYRTAPKTPPAAVKPGPKTAIKMTFDDSNRWK